jgi:Sec-independent protein translocase protein TatA
VASAHVVLDSAWTRLFVPVLVLFVVVIGAKKLARLLRRG